MRQSVSHSGDCRNAGFHKLVDGFLLHARLPFASVLTAEKIARIFREHGGLFGENGIYSTAVLLWAFLGQVLRDRKEASCQSPINLIRLTSASAAFRSDQKPRSISFKNTSQFVLGGWAVHASGMLSAMALRNVCDELLKRMAACHVGNRPGRLEPRVIQRRRHGYPLKTEPRHVLTAELRKYCT